MLEKYLLGQVENHQLVVLGAFVGPENKVGSEICDVLKTKLTRVFNSVTLILNIAQ